MCDACAPTEPATCTFSDQSAYPIPAMPSPNVRLLAMAIAWDGYRSFGTHDARYTAMPMIISKPAHRVYTRARMVATANRTMPPPKVLSFRRSQNTGPCSSMFAIEGELGAVNGTALDCKKRMPALRLAPK